MGCAEDYSAAELMAVFLSRDLRDGEMAHLGANQPVPRAAVLLAHLTHAPNMKVSQSLTLANLIDVPRPVPYSEFFTDWRRARWAESYRLGHEVFADVKRFADFFFLGGIQIDRFGNVNLIGTGTDYRRLDFRGPGSGAAAMASTFCPRYYLVAGDHNKRLLVDKVDFISAFGFGDGGREARNALGLPGGGPKYLVTPLCVMDFEPETKRMRLASLHPGVALEQVLENTSFDPVLPENIPTTAAPTSEELAVLRGRIDPQGTLRRG
ncbi:MAG: hypothetical protein KJ720_12145 [Proteobacteria bacterium]|nr:hypothetical protein [Pseudomonadota bacterium]MBU1450709.1 hypothetical protein [Pseudomonadota bacterium]MBU2468648.1 hypothetical protein [Pseudomonadota bacterium]MBU2517684.1 hypothetical protein [Pseudomonadota bacterium]